MSRWNGPAITETRRSIRATGSDRSSTVRSIIARRLLWRFEATDRRLERVDLLRQSVEELARVNDPAGRRGELDRERQPVEGTDDVCDDRQVEPLGSMSGRTSASRSMNSATAGAAAMTSAAPRASATASGSSATTVSSRTPIGARPVARMVSPGVRRSSRAAARHRTPRGRRGRRRRGMAVAQQRSDPFQDVRPLSLPDADERGQLGQQEARVIERIEVDRRDPSVEGLHEVADRHAARASSCRRRPVRRA